MREQRLCPYHAAQTHLQRLEILQASLDAPSIPLFPGAAGEQPDESGEMIERFGGHVLRVSGTQRSQAADMQELRGKIQAAKQETQKCSAAFDEGFNFRFWSWGLEFKVQ